MFEVDYLGLELAIGGLTTQVKSARFLHNGKRVKFSQKGNRLILTGLPAKRPDPIAPVIALECRGAPKQRLGAGCVIPK